MTKEEFFFYKKKFEGLLQLVRASMTSDVLKEVEHYLDVTEIEMAFELFCLELIGENISLSQDRKNEVKALAENLGLHQHSVYEPMFWEKLTEYVSVE
jgi:hypothetical protein